MNRRRDLPSLRRTGFLLLAALAVLTAATAAQDRLKSMPGYEQYLKMSKEMTGAVKPGSLSVTWKDPLTFEYTRDSKIYRYDVAKKIATEVGPAPEQAGGGMRGAGARGQGGAPERGRQVASAPSPDGKLKAFYRDRNLWMSDAAGANEVALTTDGNEKDRIKYGTASWVYGEELGQTTAMWWSPDSTKLAYFRFDEKQVDDYFLQLDQTKLYSRIDTEAYPKAGRPNPVVDLFVYDPVAKKSVKVDVRDGKPFDNGVVGHYVYRIAWSPDGTELLFNRTNRRQNILEVVAANPSTGACRVILREEWPTGWVENSPGMTFLKDGKRFIWESERNGWKNFYLYDLSGKLINPITAHTSFEAGSLVKVDEDAKLIFYTARDGDNFLKLQLHRVGLDGKGDVRLTDPAFTHSVGRLHGPRGRCPRRARRRRRRVVRDFARQQALRRCVSDPQHPAGHSPRGQRREGRRGTRGERSDEVQPTRPQEGRAIHLQSRRRQDDAVRDDPIPFELRSDEEVPGDRQRLRRSGVRRHERGVRPAERPHGVPASWC